MARHPLKHRRDRPDLVRVRIHAKRCEPAAHAGTVRTVERWIYSRQERCIMLYVLSSLLACQWLIIQRLAVDSRSLHHGVGRAGDLALAAAHASEWRWAVFDGVVATARQQVQPVQ